MSAAARACPHSTAEAAGAGEFRVAGRVLIFGNEVLLRTPVEVAPATRHLFKHSIEEQSQKLFDMLTTVVTSLDRFEDLRPTLAELGRRHVTSGVKTDHYDVMRTALLWAFAQVLEQEFDRETKSAWEDMLRGVAAVMIEATVPQPQP